MSRNHGSPGMQCQRITPRADHRKYPVECPGVPTDVRAAAGRYLLVSVAKRLYPLGAPARHGAAPIARTEGMQLALGRLANTHAPCTLQQMGIHYLSRVPQRRRRG